MNDVAKTVEEKIVRNNFSFTRKPIVIGGMAMEYYGMRKAGSDIDLVITDEDYQTLAGKYPENRKDIWGDLGVVIAEFEIWRSIALFDYYFFQKDAIAEENILIVSLDRLLFMRVCAMDVQKYKTDLMTMKEYYFRNFQNGSFRENQERHMSSYKEKNGVILAGKYGE